MLQWEHSAILLTFIKLPFVIKIFVLSIFEWPLKIVIVNDFVNSSSFNQTNILLENQERKLLTRIKMHILTYLSHVSYKTKWSPLVDWLPHTHSNRDQEHKLYQSLILLHHLRMSV